MAEGGIELKDLQKDDVASPEEVEGQSVEASTSQDAEERMKLSVRAQVASDIANIAATTASTAADCCRDILYLMSETIDIGKRRANEAVARAEATKGNFQLKALYRKIAARYRKYCSDITTKLYVRIREAAADAEMAAKAAVEAAKAAVDKGSEDVRVIEMAQEAATAAQSAAVVATRAEYAALKTMAKCLEEVDALWNSLTGTASSTSDYTRDCGTVQTSNRAAIRYAVVVAFFLGVCTLYLVHSTKLSELAETSLAWLGSLLVIYPVLHFAWECGRCYREKRRAAQNKTALQLLNRFTARVRELSVYFRENNIDFSASSDSSHFSAETVV